MNPSLTPPELFGVPMASWALLVSLLSFGIAMVALGWQVTKHFLDGGRVKVYLNTAVLEPEIMVATMRSGRFSLTDEGVAASVTRGHALEVAQLVVENPGRIPVTIYSPGLAISGHGKRRHTLTPRMFTTRDTFGADHAISDTVVRLESYGRVTFLLDYWSVATHLLEQAPRRRLAIRGFVSVAGRTRRPQKSSWKLRWRLRQGDYTAIPGSPQFTPFAVLWRELYVHLPEQEDSSRPATSGRSLTRSMAGHLLVAAMSKFDARPSRELLQEALEDEAREYGVRFPAIGFALFEGYRALDRMEGNLTAWDDSLMRSAQQDEHVDVPDVPPSAAKPVPDVGN
ncbi:hypothetical protein [Curtobacterium poinsettiae]|uniref:Uncharacterized protein n=1 Tax=Curtobacterium poinsettiae TaxID=159612 RepID=A0ABT3S5N4_9MICO|nr:hypothetical protein [Curtobacterium flaccumfaciens]MBT1610661.1 hypothetical protein [Curtobacterium flaccumfaciens pv. poinsettiae]MCX2850122.1 hypothetical protein [Curtobacterium flaccumfaciens pv. poinsettiae]UXN18312.1 hypothetical protein N8D78_15985 [Curtobacterium flaccumfaciens pv. poinsettiae]